MNLNRQKMKGSINLLAVTGILVAAVGGPYLYIDHQADLRANETMISLVDEAKSQGATLSYASVDASPITQSIKITDFVITGNEQEPDIRLGTVVLKGFSWQDLNNESNDLPTKMSINIKQGELAITKSMLTANPDLQSLVSIFGDTLSFSSHVSYKFDLDNNTLKIALDQSLEQNFSFKSDLTLGNIAWLRDIQAQQTKAPNDLMNKAMQSTLNNLSLSYENKGFIEKIRTVASDKTGQTKEQLVEQSITQLQQLQEISASQWGAVFSPLIDEMIKFTRKPEQLKLTIDPKQAITGQDFMMAFMGGESGLIHLLENAQINLKAN